MQGNFDKTIQILERDDLEEHFSKLERIDDMLAINKNYSSTKYEGACGFELSDCW
jgi:hypothetical protein